MRKNNAILFAAIGACLLSACAATDDALLRTVPVGSGTSQFKPYDFVRCVKEKWTPIAGRVREYSPSTDTQAVSVPSGGYTSQSVVLVIAQASASGTGYTIYGDVAVANRYVTATHACD
ncbi:hypothetical protein BTHE68_32560 [Burkholderia sp. THE68]|uniref:hypothetical protein n=1 Tax=Burkholderiaceae TaxID=119060 RepID=UPI0013175981|nr:MULTISPECIES: hypothetical protein [Burkholderiaceae]BBU29522.1 hypothetical protein BTHE68_32560 [Burkholderia sp. THE68]BCQ25360.1 hypothetical protein NK8_35370 [Caballeronia sp. NK8]